jgi:hypothetical protein
MGRLSTATASMVSGSGFGAALTAPLPDPQAATERLEAAAAMAARKYRLRAFRK